MINLFTTKKLCLLSFSLLVLSTAEAQQAGTLDTSFNPGSGPNNTVYEMAVQPDGKTVIVGLFYEYDGVSRSSIARVNVNGTLDTSFNPGAGFTQDASRVLLQPDGKILVAGNFDSYNGAAVTKSLVRLNPNGTVDPSFNQGGAGFTTSNGAGFIESMALQPDGKILVGGYFQQYNGAASPELIRLNPNGSLDTSFDIGAQTGGGVSEITLQPDGRILIAGYFVDVNSIPRGGVARLLADGTVDPSFTTGTGLTGGSFIWDNVTALLLQPDGKIILTGSFNKYNGIDRHHLLRLNQNGTLDMTFDPGWVIYVSNFNSVLSQAVLQPNGKIVVVGDDMTINGVTKVVARFNSNATLDTGFMMGTTNYGAYAVNLLPNGKLLLGGDFTEYDGTPIFGMARLHGDAVTGTAEEVLTGITLYPNPAREVLVVEATEGASQEPLQVEIHNAVGQLILQQTLTRQVSAQVRLDGLAEGVYTVQIMDSKRVLVRPLLIE